MEEEEEEAEEGVEGVEGLNFRRGRYVFGIYRLVESLKVSLNKLKFR